MKTIKEWLNELPDGYKERALANMNEEDQDCIFSNIADALHSAFYWRTSPEGYFFWKSVHLHLKNPLPPLP